MSVLSLSVWNDIRPGILRQFRENPPIIQDRLCFRLMLTKRESKKEPPLMCWCVNTCEHAEVPPLLVERDTSTRATHTYTHTHAHTQGLLLLFVNIPCYTQATSVWCLLCCHGNRRLALTHHIRYSVIDAWLLGLIHTHCMHRTRDSTKNDLILHLVGFPPVLLTVLFHREFKWSFKGYFIYLLTSVSQVGERIHT